MELARAVWFPGPRRAELRVEGLPAPAPGEIQIEAIVSGISPGTEMLVYRGEVDPRLPLDLPTLAGSFAYPIKYGYAAVGRVVAFGSGVSSIRRDELVFALHPHQDRFNVPAGLAHRLPSDLDPQRGVFTANLETALNALLDHPVRIGERVVVLGQGVVGLLIGLLARHNGAGRVIAVDRWPRRRELAVALGADLAEAPGNELVARIREATEGRGADVVFEASGNPTALRTAIDVVAPGGVVVVCSWYGIKPVTLDLGGRFHRDRVRIHSSQVGSLDPALAPRWDRARRMATALDLLPTLELDGLITHRFPLERAEQAYRLIDERPGETLQIVIQYGDR